MKIAKVAGGGGGFDIPTPGPVGTHPAIVVDVMDEPQKLVPSYDNPAELVKKDVTRILYAYQADGSNYLCQTWEMTVSSSPKAKLYNHLKDLMGSPPPFEDEDFDYCDLIGTHCQITVASKVSRKGKSYVFVDSVGPILEESRARCPKIEDIEVPGGRLCPIPEKAGTDKNPF
jgi:hypothetical protein